MEAISKSKKTFRLLLVIGCLFFSSFYLDIWHSPNPVSRALPALTFQENGSLEITPYAEVSMDKSKVGDKYYSDKAPLPTFLTIPAYELFAFFGIDQWNYEDKKYKKAPSWYKKLSLIIFIGAILTASIPFALLVFLGITLSKANFTFKPTFVILSFFGTYLWIYSGTFFNHILSGLFLVLSLYFAFYNKKTFLSGFFVACAFMSEYTLGLFAVLIPVLLLLHKNKIKEVLYFGLGLLPLLIVFLIYNYQITNDAFTFVFYHTNYEDFSKGIKQNYGFGLPTLESIYGLLLSPYMGLIFFFPPVLFWFVKWWKERKIELLKHPVFTSFLALFILISCYFIWWGGYSWGPRYLIPAACILAFFSPQLWEKVQKKKLALMILIGSFVPHFLAKSTVLFLIPDRLSPEGEASYPFSDVIWKAVKEGNFNSNNWLSFLFDTPPFFSALFCLLAFAIWLIAVERIYRKAYLKE